jgi:hypothetical protein
MKPTEIEDALLARLREALPSSVAIEPTPEDIEAYKGLASNGCVLVRYLSRSFKAPVVRRQKTAPKVALLVGKRSLRAGGHRDALDLLEEARNAVSGFPIGKLPDGQDLTLWPTDETMIAYDKESGIHWYKLTLAGLDFFDSPKP